MKNDTKQLQMTKGWAVALLATFCCLLWGSAFPCIKIGYQLFQIDASDTASQILFAGCRFFLAGLLVILFESIRNRSFLLPKRNAIPSILKLGMVQTVLQYLLFYMGLANTTAMKSSIITGSNVFLTILVAALIFRYEKLTGQKLLGCLFGFSGVILINLNGSGLDASMKLAGEGAIFLSALSHAFSAAMIKKYSKTESPVTLSGYQFLFGGILLILAGLIFGGHVHGFSGASTLLLLYLAFISAAAYTLWGILLKYNPVAKVSVYGFLNPVCGVLLSALLLQECSQAVGGRGLLALLLVCLGILTVNLPKKQPVP